jgi:hypothetical protein
MVGALVLLWAACKILELRCPGDFNDRCDMYDFSNIPLWASLVRELIDLTFSRLGYRDVMSNILGGCFSFSASLQMVGISKLIGVFVRQVVVS